MKLLCFILSFLFSTTFTLADTRSEQRTWLGLFANKKITSDFNFWAETQLRHDESHQTMNQVLNRFGLLRPLNAHHEIGLLFAYVQSNTAKEYRPTLQYTYKSQLGLNSFALRNRLEFRELEEQEAKSIRWRTQLRWAQPLNEASDFVIWDEPFLTITHEDWTGNRVVERNRLFIGQKFKWPEFALEIGYLNQFIPRETKSIYEHSFVTYLIF
jgi:Protein of unknown function (DUF2490)